MKNLLIVFLLFFISRVGMSQLIEGPNHVKPGSIHVYEITSPDSRYKFKEVHNGTIIHKYNGNGENYAIIEWSDERSQLDAEIIVAGTNYNTEVKFHVYISPFGEETDDLFLEGGDILYSLPDDLFNLRECSDVDKVEMRMDNFSLRHLILDVPEREGYQNLYYNMRYAVYEDSTSSVPINNDGGRYREEIPSGQSVTRYGELQLRFENFDNEGKVIISSRRAVTLAHFENPTPPVVPATAIKVFENNPATLALEASNTNIKWYADMDLATPLHEGNSFTTPPVQQDMVYYVTTTNTETGCESAAAAVKVEMVPPPTIEKGRGFVNLNMALQTQDTYDTYTWKKNDETEVSNASSYLVSNTPDHLQARYHVEVTSSLIQGVGKSTPFYVNEGSFRGTGRHFVTINTPLKKVKREEDLATLDAKDLHQVTTYLDNALRPTQQVVTQGAPDRQDIVSFKQYDKLGREPKGYLPYVGGNNGFMQEDPLAKQADFYQNTPSIAHTEHPYQQQHYDHSPLNVVRQSSVVGMDGDADVDTTPPPNVRIDATNVTHRNEQTYYANNADNEVRLFTYDFDTGEIKAEGYYNTRQLMVQKVGKKQMGRLNEPVTTYTNKLGQTVLKKVPTGIETYYVYDDFGQGRITIPPKGVAALESRGDNFTLEAAFLNQWCYQYDYDADGRMTMKKAPQAAPIYMVYNQRDELILSQDGNQRAQDQWQFYKYDELGREVFSGIYTHAESLDQVAMQALVDQETVFFEKPNTAAATHYYTNRAFPTTGEVLQVAYYDHYDYTQDGTPDASYNEGFQSDFTETAKNPLPTPIDRLKDMVTVTKTKVLNGQDDWLTTAVFYDEDYNPIQLQAQTYVAEGTFGEDLVTTQYGYDGREIKSVVRHRNPKDVTRSQVKIATRYEYDRLGRVLAQYHQIDNQPEQLLASFSYNVLGQVTEKTVGDDLETMTYGYHLLGWLETLNDPSDESQAEKLFQMQLTHGFLGETRHFGEVTELAWRTQGDALRKYKYEYSDLRQLNSALYSDQDAETNQQYSVRNLTYDANGNLLTLKRKGLTDDLDGTYGDTDDLTYTYEGNQLVAVEDAITTDGALGDFQNRNAYNPENNPVKDFTYDANGNLLSDANNKVVSITYNFLDQPEIITYQSGAYLQYTYDAVGNKLRKAVYTPDGNGGVALDKTHTYLGMFEYEDDALHYLHTAQGRAVAPQYQAGNDNTFAYEYYYTDQQGNVRVIFGTPATLPTAIANMEQPEEDGYYQIAQSRVNTTQAGKPSAYAGNYVAETNPTQPVGPWKKLAVGKGDLLNLRVQARYLENAQNNQGNTVSVFLTNIAEGSDPELAAEASRLVAGLALSPQRSNNTDALPRAFLKVMFFDLEDNYVGQQLVFVEEDAKTAWQELALESVRVPQNGYAHVLVGNDSDADVWFDMLETEQVVSPIVQENHFYPFGSIMAGLGKEAVPQNRYFYNGGSEAQKHLSGNQLFYETDWRGYDPQTGRFKGIDAMGELFPGLTPYQYAYNNPIGYNDPTGLIPFAAIVAKIAGVSKGVSVGMSVKMPSIAGQMIKVSLAKGTVATGALNGVVGQAGNCCPDPGFINSINRGIQDFNVEIAKMNSDYNLDQVNIIADAYKPGIGERWNGFIQSLNSWTGGTGPGSPIHTFFMNWHPTATMLDASKLSYSNTNLAGEQVSGLDRGIAVASEVPAFKILKAGKIGKMLGIGKNVVTNTAKTSGWVKRKIFKSLDPVIQTKVKAAIKKGIVEPTGKQGIIKLTKTEAAETGYSYKVKILGKGGDLRIYGNKDVNGHIVFDKLMGH